MGSYKKVGLLAGAASVTLGSMAFGEITPSDRDARIAALESEIQAIKADTGSNWLTDARAEEMRMLVQEVIADSETRASLLGNGGTAGWDNGFYLSNGDGSFTLNLSGQIDFRYIYNNRNNASDEDDTSGFEARRTKLKFKGNLFSKKLSYSVTGAFDRSDGAFGLEDAYGKWDLGDGWGFKWGQFKLPFNHEELVSSSMQLAVDRSFVNEIVNLDYSQGVEFSYAGDQCRFWFAFSDGSSQGNTAWNNTTGDTEWAFTSRVEWLAAGSDWSNFNDYTSLGTEEFGLMIGGGVHWQSDDYNSSNNDETKVFQWTVDAALEDNGWNLAAAFYGAHTDPSLSSSRQQDQYGFTLQGGAFLQPDKLEIFGQWGWYDFDDPTMTSDSIDVLTFGLNYYIDGNGHAWKWTNDIVWALDPVPSSTSFSGIGLLADNGVDEDQIAIRSQMQILF